MAKRTVYTTPDFKIVEFTPQPRTISLDIKRKETFGEKFFGKAYLGLPYVQCGLYRHPEMGCLFFASFTKKPMVNLDDPVGVPLLPNIHGDLSVYMPDHIDTDLDASIEGFFTSYFTDRDAFYWPGINGTKELFGNYQNWEAQTKIDPKFILKSPLLRPISPVVEGIQLARSMRYSDIPKMDSFLIHTAQKKGVEIPEVDPVEALIQEMAAQEEDIVQKMAEPAQVNFVAGDWQAEETAEPAQADEVAGGWGKKKINILKENNVF